MAWTKAQLIADLQSKFIGVGTASGGLGIAERIEGPILGISKYAINVTEVGISENSRVQTGYRKNIVFYVYNEGQGDENAYYERVEPVNTSNTDITLTTSGFSGIANIYNSKVLQQRILGAVITQCQTVFQETSGTANHINRMKLVKDSMDNIANVVMRFMLVVSLNNNVQNQGTAVSDTVLQNIVINSWNAISNIIIA